MENKNKYVICCWRNFNIEFFSKRFSKLLYDFTFISKKEDLSYKKLKEIEPKFVFFVDWSYIVEERIVNNFRCINFHSSNLPYYRGGSPIQNQIINGVKKTKLTAFIMDEGIDTGKIILQRNLSLGGGAKNIWHRIQNLSYKMILEIIAGNYKVKKQVGAGSYFRRRKPNESKLDFSWDLQKIYDFIRMLEYPYPNAWYIIDDKKIIFKSAKLKNNKIKIIAEIVEDK